MVCEFCGCDYVLIESTNTWQEYECKGCGARLTYSESDERNCYPFYNGEPFTSTFHGVDTTCSKCGSYTIWENDFMLSDLYDDIDDKDDRVVRYLSCPNCGGMIELIEPKDGYEKDL